ncbi:hypothetical protein BDK51DRAFT_52061 [Blyttiomyces helicus]|uniref:Uncharacterized protein n=1 Tax=Blyttiomyces helicus TaxID=388810 RepID=A0A4V1IRI5_9FUNG|nr:hypothetical protein BDK51DRAFT_52061 [Blyttiomyces helicus]|eukprot:RKO90177.1 hypothetical protein BDK51DRAFT_52061 [Blyttiomyces helicus]
MASDHARFLNRQCEGLKGIDDRGRLTFGDFLDLKVSPRIIACGVLSVTEVQNSCPHHILSAVSISGIMQVRGPPSPSREWQQSLKNRRVGQGIKRPGADVGQKHVWKLIFDAGTQRSSRSGPEFKGGTQQEPAEESRAWEAEPGAIATRKTDEDLSEQSSGSEWTCRRTRRRHIPDLPSFLSFLILLMSQLSNLGDSLEAHLSRGNLHKSPTRDASRVSSFPDAGFSFRHSSSSNDNPRSCPTTSLDTSGSGQTRPPSLESPQSTLDTPPRTFHIPKSSVNTPSSPLEIVIAKPAPGIQHSDPALAMDNTTSPLSFGQQYSSSNLANLIITGCFLWASFLNVIYSIQLFFVHARITANALRVVLNLACLANGLAFAVFAFPIGDACGFTGRFGNIMSHVLLLCIDMLLILRVITLSRKNKDRIFFSILLITRIGVAILDIIKSPSTTDPDSTCTYHQYQASSLAYLITDVVIDLSVTVRVIHIILATERHLRKEDGGTESPNSHILGAVMNISVFRSTLIFSFNVAILVLSEKEPTSPALIILNTVAFMAFSYVLTYESLAVVVTAKHIESRRASGNGNGSWLNFRPQRKMSNTGITPFAPQPARPLSVIQEVARPQTALGHEPIVAFAATDREHSHPAGRW